MSLFDWVGRLSSSFMFAASRFARLIFVCAAADYILLDPEVGLILRLVSPLCISRFHVLAPAIFLSFRLTISRGIICKRSTRWLRANFFTVYSYYSLLLMYGGFVRAIKLEIL